LAINKLKTKSFFPSFVHLQHCVSVGSLMLNSFFSLISVRSFVWITFFLSFITHFFLFLSFVPYVVHSVFFIIILVVNNCLAVDWTKTQA
jgi:hypothetical protein